MTELALKLNRPRSMLSALVGCFALASSTDAAERPTSGAVCRRGESAVLSCSTIRHQKIALCMNRQDLHLTLTLKTLGSSVQRSRLAEPGEAILDASAKGSDMVIAGDSAGNHIALFFSQSVYDRFAELQVQDGNSTDAYRCTDASLVMPEIALRVGGGNIVRTDIGGLQEAGILPSLSNTSQLP